MDENVGELFRKYIDMINEAQEGPADIQQIAAGMKFLPTHKHGRPII